MVGLFCLVQEMALPKASDVQQGGQIKVIVVDEWTIELAAVGIYCSDIVFGTSAFVLDGWGGYIRRIEGQCQSSEAL